MWKDASKADKAAEAMRITAQDLLEMEVIEGIIPEPRGGAHRDYETTATAIKQELLIQLQELSIMNSDELLEDRYSIKPSPDLLREMEQMLGQDTVKIR